jgi:hypothetical protein
MRLSMLVCCCFLIAAALAHKVSLKEGWLLEFTTTDGKFSRVGVYDTREACEAAIPAVLKEQSGYNGHCVYSNPKTGEITGSQDPAFSNH